MIVLSCWRIFPTTTNTGQRSLPVKQLQTTLRVFLLTETMFTTECQICAILHHMCSYISETEDSIIIISRDQIFLFISYIFLGFFSWSENHEIILTGCCKLYIVIYVCNNISYLFTRTQIYIYSINSYKLNSAISQSLPLRMGQTTALLSTEECD